MSQSERLFNVVDTISHLFSSKKDGNEYFPTHHETPEMLFSPTEDSLKLSDILNYIRVADDDSLLSNASSNDISSELEPSEPSFHPPLLDPIDHSGGGENFGG